MNSYRLRRPLDLLGIFVTGILGSVLMGAFSSAVNSLISPEYFVNIMRWQGVGGIWQASIFQGMLEGLILGAGLSLAFTIVVAITTRLCCPYAVAARHLLGILASGLAFWAAAGLFEVCLCAFIVVSLQHSTLSDPTLMSRLKFAWTDGSIRGAEIGGTLCAILGAAMFPRRWEAYFKAEEAREFQLTK